MIGARAARDCIAMSSFLADGSRCAKCGIGPLWPVVGDEHAARARRLQAHFFFFPDDRAKPAR